MKKILIIITFILFFTQNSQADDFYYCSINDTCSFFGKMKHKIKNLNPKKIYANRKKCQDLADKSNTVADGKKFFKKCIKSPNDY